jgi:hypothetical protein
LDALSYALVKKKVNYVLDADIQGFFEEQQRTRSNARNDPILTFLSAA